MKRVRGTESPMSFFSFQDIIACVTGIMILVTLILALNPLGKTITSVTTPGQGTTPQVADPSAAVRLDEAKARQKAARDSLEQLKREIEERRTRPEITLAQVERAEQQAESEVQSIRSLQARLDATRERIEVAVAAEAAAKAELVELDKREVDARRAQAKARMRLRLLEGAPEGFDPVLVEVTPNGIAIGTVDAEGVPSPVGEAGSGMAATALRTFLGGRDLKVTLVLFIVQPGGIELFSELRAMIASAVEVGWQLWDPTSGGFFESSEKLVLPGAGEPTEGAAPTAGATP